MNSNSSTSTQSLSGTTNPWIQKTLMPQSGATDDDNLPIAAICGKQCSNLQCICGNKNDPCCSCMDNFKESRAHVPSSKISLNIYCYQPFNEEDGCNPTLVKIITCSCINCNSCCKSDTKKIDWVSIIICDKCFGPGGWCSCENCDVECNFDCNTINCLCFTIYNGPQASARQSQRSLRHSESSSNNSQYYSDNGEPIKYPPLPSTDRSFISYPDSSRTMISSISSAPCTERDGRYFQRRLSSSLELQSDFPSNRSIRSTSRSAIAPHQDVQLFAPRNQANMNGVQPVSGKKLSSKKKVTETKVKMLSNSQKGDDGNLNTNAKSDTQTSVATNPDNQQRILNNTEGRNSVRFSPDVTSTTQSALHSERLNQSHDMENSSRPNTSSSVASSNSLSATSEALLAQYQLMDAEKLTPR
ncbi:hypothetical protein LOTGIDRAFT_160673 [Lottia gigantea]|uniref:Uncharacterized protein n=1 Tax=Lottia gigantea TaxID=225164 RepID=V3ZVH7_LOTGI|nr:hypothetical protein LOTGIDRAFT_160673 [Lottia gigantea]ESO95513.1 hypothetical protein LOTGIDRAFT_160673 [Lottia gigantea]